MTLRRMSVPAMHLIFEWEDDGPEFAFAIACRGVEERQVAYGMVRGVSEAASRLGVEWQDLEMTERFRPVCGMTVMALVWRGEVLNGDGAERVAEVVSAGLGVQGAE